MFAIYSARLILTVEKNWWWITVFPYILSCADISLCNFSYDTYVFLRRIQQCYVVLWVVPRVNRDGFESMRNKRIVIRSESIQLKWRWRWTADITLVPDRTTSTTCSLREHGWLYCLCFYYLFVANVDILHLKFLPLSIIFDFLVTHDWRAFVFYTSACIWNKFSSHMLCKDSLRFKLFFEPEFRAFWFQFISHSNIYHNFNLYYLKEYIKTLKI